MSGFNKNLPKNEKIQCLCCLSTQEPEISNNRVLCVDCGSLIQAYLNLEVTKPKDKPTITNEAGYLN